MDEVGWLIENSIGGRAVWWRAVSNDCGRVWTTDSNEAIRFSRQSDAEQVIRGLHRLEPFMEGAVATEHMWVRSGPKDV